eukprot:g44540.t1
MPLLSFWIIATPGPTSLANCQLGSEHVHKQKLHLDLPLEPLERLGANSDTTSYHPLDHERTSDHQANISQTINNLNTSGELLSTASNLIVPQPYTTRVALDICMGPSYARFFVGFMEEPLFNNYTGTISHLFLCYIDLCIGAASCSHKMLQQFINFANTFHSPLKRPNTDLRTGSQHLRSAHTNQPDLLVAIHFNSPGDMSIFGFLHWQILGSLQPNGLNIDFTSFK